MARLYQVSFRFEVIPDAAAMKKMDVIFSGIGDWLRFTSWTWCVSSQFTPTQIREKLRLVMNPSDHFLILEITAKDADGWAAPWIWEWIRAKGH